MTAFFLVEKEFLFLHIFKVIHILNLSPVSDGFALDFIVQSSSSAWLGMDYFALLLFHPEVIKMTLHDLFVQKEIKSMLSTILDKVLALD